MFCFAFCFGCAVQLSGSQFLQPGIKTQLSQINKSIFFKVHQASTLPALTGHLRVVQSSSALSEQSHTYCVTFFHFTERKSLFSLPIFSTQFAFLSGRCLFQPSKEDLSKYSTSSFPHRAFHNNTDRFRSQVGSITLNKWVKDRINKSSNSSNCEIIYI